MNSIDADFDNNASAREIFSPSALVRMARDVLEDTFALIWIEAEISNFARPASGHLYFSLKDAQAQVRCAMFRPKSTYLRFKPADGQRVLARARVSLYEARGEFQLIIEHMEPAGVGALLREFELLKARLAAEGLFESSRKRAIPKMPRRIGVITSPTGAAVRDVISVLARRFALAEIDVLAVPVQGKEAPAAIVRMLEASIRANRHDVLLLTRGGGSLEDLWAFNDEALARAIHASTIPVISAVGHEVDFTIADFVADLRAATPSAAAELLAPESGELLRALKRDRAQLVQSITRRLRAFAQRADHAQARLRAQHPRSRLRLGRERLQQLHARLRVQHPLVRFDARRHALLGLSRRLLGQTRSGVQRRASHLRELARALNGVSPLATLQRGYAIIFDAADGRIVRSVSDVHAEQLLKTRVGDGDFLARVVRDA